MASSDQLETDIQPSANVSDADSNHPQPLLASDTAAQSEFTTISITTDKPILVPIARLNRSIHGRASRDESHVRKLDELRIGGVELPPVDAYWDEIRDELWLADGEHRTTVFERAGETHIAANVHEGGRQEAIAFAMKCDRGLRRQSKDDEHCLRLLLQDPEWAQWSSRVIAERLGLKRRTVDRIRDRIEGNVVSPRVGADGRIRKPRTSTGALTQLSGRKPSSDWSKPAEDLQCHDEPTPGQQRPRTDIEAELMHLTRSLVGELQPVILQEILGYIPKILASDPSLDARTIIAHALAWGFDSLANTPQSSRYKRTPQQCDAYLREVAATVNARSYTLPTEEPRKLDTVDYMQQVIGANTMSPDDIHVALKSIGRMPACSDPVMYVRFLLSSNRDIFLRIAGKEGLVGVYLADDNPYRVGKSIVANDQRGVAV